MTLGGLDRDPISCLALTPGLYHTHIFDMFALVSIRAQTWNQMVRPCRSRRELMPAMP